MRSRKAATFAAIAAFVGMSANAAAATDDPAGTVVTPTGASTLATEVVPLAGDAGWLVYADVQVLGDRSTGATQLEVTDGTGSPSALGSSQLSPNGYAGTFSLVGDVLTTINAEPAGYQIVTWWDVATGQTGESATLPGAWLGSSPDGWYYAVGNAVYDESTLGVVKPLATAFPSDPAESVITGNAGPGGVVVTGDHGDVDYLTTDGSVVPLKTLWPSWATYDYIRCAGTSDAETLCVEYADSAESPAPIVAHRLSLDGQTVKYAPPACDGANAPAAAFVDGRMVCADDVVSSQNPDGSVDVSTYHVGRGIGYGAIQVVSALGTAVVANPAQTQLETVTTATVEPEPLLTAPISEVSSGAFALSSGRIVFTSDSSYGGVAAPGSSAAAQSAVSNTTAGFTVLPSAPIAPAGWQYVYASGLTTAYTRKVTTNGLSDWTMVVVSPQHTSTVTKVLRSTVSASGNRVLYRTVETPAHRWGRYMLLDATTGKRTPVAALNTANNAIRGFTPSKLWGSYVAYSDGTELYRLNVQTGKRTRVAAYRGQPDDTFGAPLLVYGPYVGWAEGGSLGGGTGEGVYRNVTAGTAAVKLPEGSFIEGMTNDGLLTGNQVDHSYDNGEIVPNSYSLRGYAANATPTDVLTAPDALSRAQLSDSVIAWTDGSHLVRVAPVAGPVATPLWLGDPYVERVKATHTWHFAAPFSASLSTCSVTISRGGKSVQNLRCDAHAMAFGVAQAQSRLAAGRYTWQVAVTGTSGVTTSKSGTFLVG